MLFENDKVPVWQPWSADIRNNEKIHVYLDKNNMRRLIPVKYNFPKDHPLYVKPIRKKDLVQSQHKKRRRLGKY